MKISLKENQQITTNCQLSQTSTWLGAQWPTWSTNIANHKSTHREPRPRIHPQHQYHSLLETSILATLSPSDWVSHHLPDQPLCQFVAVAAQERSSLDHVTPYTLFLFFQSTGIQIYTANAPNMTVPARISDSSLRCTIFSISFESKQYPFPRSNRILSIF